MSVNTSITNAVIGLVLVTILIGAFLGVLLGGTELLNPYSSRATAQQMEMETAIQAQRENVDLEIYEQEQADLLAFRQAQRELELAHQAEKQALDLKMTRIRGTAFTIAGCVAMVLVGGGFAFYLISAVRRNRDSVDKQEEIDRLRNELLRLARANEQLSRRQSLLRQLFREGIERGNSKGWVPIQN
jgi:ABC-type transport system involved in cytochrome bd biosynthesis fused ATPase/permease subunit